MDELEKLEADRVRINYRIWGIQAKRRAEENRPLLGKCFKYRNSYGGDREKWWLYIKVTKVSARGEMSGLQFQTDCHNKLEIEFAHRIPINLSGGYVPITQGEFNRALRAVQKRVARLQP